MRLPQPRVGKLYAGFWQLEASSRSGSGRLLSPLRHRHELQSIGTRRAVSRERRAHPWLECKCGLARARTTHQRANAYLRPIQRIWRFCFSRRLAQQEWSGWRHPRHRAQFGIDRRLVTRAFRPRKFPGRHLCFGATSVDCSMVYFLVIRRFAEGKGALVE